MNADVKAPTKAIDKIGLARGNHEFYFVCVGGLVMCRDDHSFDRAVIAALYNEDHGYMAQYGIEVGKFSGYVLIDCSFMADLEESLADDKCDELGNLIDDDIIGRVAMKIPFVITGELNHIVTIELEGWRFALEITKYESNDNGCFKEVFDPVAEGTPEDMKLGRYIVLKIAPTNTTPTSA